MELRGLSLLVHLLALYAAWGYALAPRYGALISVLLLFSCWHADRGLRALLGLELVVSVDGVRWCGEPVQQLTVGWLRPLLISLSVRADTGKTVRLWLTPRMIGADAHRRLRIWLRIEQHQDEARGT